MKVYKRHIIDAVSERTGENQSTVEKIYEEILDQVRDHVAKDGVTVDLREIGRFESYLTKARKERPARDPRTGELTGKTIPAKCPERKVRFQQSTSIKKHINKQQQHN